MNVNFGIFPNLPLPEGVKKLRLKKADKYRLYADRALLQIEETKKHIL